ncbi:hypothetical protein BWQ96_09993 [Gracilariopsis chorda]|uniref:Uncharacterized protein n=1 Tax=Gracilariopsis chorda TaxID=448386 RepID=A0A2V3IE28_9FLOR|nr:hypothetical protein BWQ96_09993 [Gracilariopsis chorda]|eukprot:PXF40301.1 hypothetical protein BWQ96_09993 [Gracilariopsis chorda]
MRRKNGAGSQRSAAEIFNRTHAAWENLSYDSSYVIISKDRARRIRLRIRKTLYSGGYEDHWTIYKGKLTYEEADSHFHRETQGIRRKLNAAFSFLHMVEDYWVAELFVQEVFKTEKTYKKDSKDWVHPTKRYQQRPNEQAEVFERHSIGCETSEDATEIIKRNAEHIER